MGRGAFQFRKGGEMQTCLLEFKKDGLKVKYTGMWKRIDIQKCFLAMLRALPAYIVEMRKQLEKVKEEKKCRAKKRRETKKASSLTTTEM